MMKTDLEKRINEILNKDLLQDGDYLEPEVYNLLNDCASAIHELNVRLAERTQAFLKKP